MGKPKIAVVGLGTMGVQALWQLSRRGVDVTGYETHAPGHSRGAAGGENRLFRTLELEDSRYAPVVSRADELWEQLQAESGRELRTTTGVLLTGSPDDPDTLTALRSAADTGAPHEVWEEAELVRRVPALRPDPGDIGVWDPRGGFIRPELTVASTAALAEARGAVVHRGARVLDVSAARSGVSVTTEDGAAVYDRVLVAAGGWTAKLLPRFRDLVETRRLISAWFFGRSAGSLAGLPPFIRPRSTYAYGIPTTDGTAVKIGLGYHDHLPVSDPDTVERTTRPEDLEPFQAVVRRYFPDLDPHPMRTETYLETYTPTRREYMGEHPDVPGLVVLAGFSGHGFKMCPAIGEIGADLVLGEEPALDVGFLDEDRLPL